MSLIFRKFKTGEWLQLVGCLLLVTAQVWLDLKLPDYMARITTLLQTSGSDVSGVWNAGGYMLLCALGSLVCAVSVGFFAARIGKPHLGQVPLTGSSHMA